MIGNGKIYWLVPAPEGAARSGPFVNHSHYAQYVNLSMGAALGLVLLRLQRTSPIVGLNCPPWPTTLHLLAHESYGPPL